MEALGEAGKLVKKQLQQSRQEMRVSAILSDDEEQWTKPRKSQEDDALTGWLRQVLANKQQRPKLSRHFNMTA